jgi:hypothetical protein
MKATLRIAVSAAAAALAVFTATAGAGTFEITPAKQAEIDQQRDQVAKWAADPVIVNAVREQNRKGPIAGMDNTKWKTLRASEETVTAFQMNAAGTWLKSRMDESGGLISEAFLNAAQGEKVAFVEKTSSYIHKGAAKFDQPMAGHAWQGKPEFDESSQTFAIQVSVPVVDAGSPVGALVVGINLTRLEKLAKNKK